MTSGSAKINPPHSTPSPWISFLAHFLLILSAWTLVIKYIFPITYAIAYGLPLTTHVFWDLWPLAHVWLAWAMLRWQPYTKLLAVSMSAIEIVIIVTLFYRFLSGPDPDWNIWRTNWFINKIFVLSCFILILGTFVFFRENLKIRPTPPSS